MGENGHLTFRMEYTDFRIRGYVLLQIFPAYLFDGHLHFHSLSNFHKGDDREHHIDHSELKKEPRLLVPVHKISVFLLPISES